MQKRILYLFILLFASSLLMAQNTSNNKKKNKKKQEEVSWECKRIKLTDAEMEILHKRIFFELNSSELDSIACKTLDLKIELMERYPDLNILLLGSSSNLGNSQISASIGLRRANSARRYMMAKGISEERLSTMTKECDDCDLDEHKDICRRVDFEIDRR